MFPAADTCIDFRFLASFIPGRKPPHQPYARFLTRRRSFLPTCTTGNAPISQSALASDLAAAPEPDREVQPSGKSSPFPAANTSRTSDPLPAQTLAGNRHINGRHNLSRPRGSYFQGALPATHP